MLFPTADFALFFLAVMAGTTALAGRNRAGKLFLVAASYVFYGSWNWHFCFLLAASSLLSYATGLALGAARRQGRQWVVAAGVGCHLLLLGTFKYFDFVVESLNALGHALGLGGELPFMEILLPVGISFFTFHGISYIVDVYRGDVAVCRRVEDMLLYLSFFPQLVAGPIVRASQFLPQLARPPDGPIDVAPALALILGGLVKKVVLANYLATKLVDPVFFDPSSFGTLDLVLAAYGYAAQIYCDFSAYSDMAIGLAALLGYRFPRNFDQPYRAERLREFWRRWHISLSSWLRDYLYKPLGGSRRGPWQTARNLMVTMLLGGIWHGAAWNYVAWGAIHGAGLLAERALLPMIGERSRTPAGRVLSVLLVFHFVCLAWIFFRAGSLDQAMVFLAALGNWQPGLDQATPFTLGLLAVGLALHALPRDVAPRLAARLRWPAWALGAATGIGVAAIDAMGPEGVAPFIYFRF
jgi:D-alanyl-lipoteichoic acid acyltransferase DltB (MBOAT superfamily)